MGYKLPLLKDKSSKDKKTRKELLEKLLKIYQKYPDFEFTFDAPDPDHDPTKLFLWNSDHAILNYYVPQKIYDREHSSAKVSVGDIYDFAMPVLQTAVWGLNGGKAAGSAAALTALDIAVQKYVKTTKANPFLILYNAIVEEMKANRIKDDVNEVMAATTSINDFLGLTAIGTSRYAAKTNLALYTKRGAKGNFKIDHDYFTNLLGEIDLLNVEVSKDLNKLNFDDSYDKGIRAYIMACTSKILLYKAHLNLIYEAAMIDKKKPMKDWDRENGPRENPLYETYNNEIALMAGHLKRLINIFMYKHCLPKYDPKGKTKYQALDEYRGHYYKYSGSEVIFSSKNKRAWKSRVHIDWELYKSMMDEKYDYRFTREKRKQTWNETAYYATMVDRTIGDGDYVYMYHYMKKNLNKFGLQHLCDIRIANYAHAKYWFFVPKITALLDAHKELVKAGREGLSFKPNKTEEELLEELLV